MKFLSFLTILICAIGCSSLNADNSKTSASQEDKKYPVAVSFGSICCGTASDDFLKAFTNSFNKKHSANINADIASGCGREGEFVILFNLPENKTAINSRFIAELEKTVKDTDEKNKKANSSSGGMEVVYAAKATDYSHCRLGFKKWLM